MREKGRVGGKSERGREGGRKGRREEGREGEEEAERKGGREGEGVKGEWVGGCSGWDKVYMM